MQNLSYFRANFLDLIDVLAIVIDQLGTIRIFNRRAEDFTGLKKGEATGQDFFSLLPEEERDQARQQLQGSLRRGAGPLSLSLSVRARNGDWRPVCWSFNPVPDDEGGMFGMFGLGFPADMPGAPCLEMRDQMESYCSTIGTLTHNLLNHSQVVMGYLEMAADHTGDNKELHCMLKRATISMVKCGEIAINVHKISNDHQK